MGPTDAAPPALQMSEETPRCVQAPACSGAGASLCPHGRPRGDMSPQPPRGPASHQHVAWEQLPGALAAHGRSSSFIIHRRLGPAVAGFFFFCNRKAGREREFLKSASARTENICPGGERVPRGEWGWRRGWRRIFHCCSLGGRECSIRASLFRLSQGQGG